MRSLPFALLVSLAFGAFLRPYELERLDHRGLASTTVEDTNGVFIAELVGTRGGFSEWMPLDAMAPALIDATLAGEDADFHSHRGIDPRAIVRSVWLNVRARRLAYGGSTISQQLSKVIDREPRNIIGKLAEAWDTLRLERALSKDEILAQYLNRVYYGRNAYGVEKAAQRFFGKRARDLSLDEAALLAVLPRAPSRYDPARHPGAALRRRAHVLDLMVKLGSVSREAAEEAKIAPIRLAPVPRIEPVAPHFIDALIVRGDLEAHPAHLRSTLDIALQRSLTARLREHLRRVADAGIGQAGIVVVDNETGGVLALVGSGAYGDLATDGSVNAVTMHRHPGSVLKPFVYALAVEDGAHGLSPVVDVPTNYRGYSPRNASGHFLGVVPMATALGSSLNVPATRVAQAVGPARVAQTLNALGIRSIDTTDEASVTIALGDRAVTVLEIAEAYRTLARGGMHDSVRLLARDERERGTRIFSEETAFLVTKMLSDRNARAPVFGPETPFDLPFEVAAKTGTSQAYADNVAAAYTRDVTIVAWAGNFDGDPTRRTRAMDGIAPLVREALLAVAETRTPRAFDAPVGVRQVELCARSGMLPTEHCTHRATTYVTTAHAPSATCTWHDQNGESLPAEAHGWQADVTRPSVQEENARLRLLGLRDGMRVYIDPTLPRGAQALSLRAIASNTDRVGWEVDGDVVAEVGAPFSASLPLVAGTHHILVRALAEGSSLTAEAHISVIEGIAP